MEEERRNLEPGVGRSTRRRREASGQKETGEGSRRDDALTQERAPIYEALEAFQKMRVVPFDVPGHKRGRGNPELTKLLGETCMRLDVNSMKPLDNLCHPVSVIADAEQLAAEAFGAAHAFLMVGGTTSAVQSMVLTAVKRGEKIILPRNVHRSVMGAMVLGGAVPVYVNPAGDKRLGIPLGMRVEDVRRAIKENPDAKAVFVNNPTYYGICSDLRSIVKLAHEHGMLCLADEAHGTHFYFGENMPVSAMAAGADMAAVSMHKSGGSLTQSSILLTGPGMSAGYVRQIINLTQTTSGSYLLLSSLDISRRNLALRGREAFKQVVELAEKNAKMVLSQDKEKIKREELRTIGAMNQIGSWIGLSGIKRVEAYDISNISGFESVGSMIVYENGRPKRNDYRKFRIRTVQGPNDYASMREVLLRRFSHGLEETKKLQAEGGDLAMGSFTRFPDLLMMDGGRGQVNIALEVLRELQLEIPVCGMVKDDNHRTRGLYYQNVEIPIDRHSEGFQLITRIQDEAHRFAIEYHRSLRGKEQVRSVLDDIKGIGPARRKSLMRTFKTIEAAPPSFNAS